MYLSTIDINSVSEAELEEELLLQNKNERLKIEKCIYKSKKQTLVGRILLRKMLLQYYNCKTFQVTYNENGKPFTDVCNFSISHSDDIVVCCLDDKSVGVDIQHICDVKKRDKYILYTEDESKFVNCSENISKSYITLWTIKEAYIKAIGGKLTDISKISFVKYKNKLLKEYNGFILKTSYYKDYIISVCLRAD